MPVPNNTKWSNSSGLKKCLGQEKDSVNDPLRVTLSEAERFSNLPSDIKDEERMKMHEFFFG